MSKHDYIRGRIKPYTVAEVAALLPVGRQTIYDACSRGEIPHTRIGDRLLIPASFVDRAITGETAANVS